jgi:hypothetical protein
MAGEIDPITGGTVAPSAGSGKKGVPSLGWIYIWSDSPSYSLTCLLGETSPTATKGVQSYGGWQTVKRKRRRSLTEWPGVEPLTQDVSIMIDKFAQGTSIEALITQLERMAGRTRPGAPDHEPPLVHFESMGVVPHDYHREPQTEWVIQNIEFGDADRNIDGNRIRQAVTITFTEYIEDDDIAGLTSAQRRRLAKAKKSVKKGKGAKGAKEKRYVVKGSEETMETIAARELGKSSRWHEIKKLNPTLRDPKKIIPAGTTVNLP